MEASSQVWFPGSKKLLTSVLWHCVGAVLILTLEQQTNWSKLQLSFFEIISETLTFNLQAQLGLFHCRTSVTMNRKSVELHCKILINTVKSFLSIIESQKHKKERLFQCIWIEEKCSVSNFLETCLHLEIRKIRQVAALKGKKRKKLLTLKLGILILADLFSFNKIRLKLQTEMTSQEGCWLQRVRLKLQKLEVTVWGVVSWLVRCEQFSSSFRPNTRQRKVCTSKMKSST